MCGNMVNQEHDSNRFLLLQREGGGREGRGAFCVQDTGVTRAPP